MKTTYKGLLFFLIFSLACLGCKKQLDQKPNNLILVPTTPAQLQGLLDNPEIFAYGHTLGLVAADEFYFTPTYYPILPKFMRNVYTWQQHPFDSTEVPYDWSRFYQQVFYANVVLERINELLVNAAGDRDLNRIKGDAMFKRALAFFHLLQIFAPAYDNATAPLDPGIPLKLKSEEETRLTRADVQTCYEQVLSDLNDAKELLQTQPDPFHRNRACAIAAMGLLARVHLCMGNWDKAASEAGAVFKNYSSLINYNAIKNQDVPFAADNIEVIYPLKAPDKGNENGLVAGLAGAGANVDSNFIRSYDTNDLRVPLFFHQHGKTWGLRASYTGLYVPFEGIAVSEMYLILAESNAHLGKPDTALSYLEKLLLNRYITNKPLNLPDVNKPDLVLDRILIERKKEMAFHGQRWADIKRLNKQNGNIIQHRFVDNQTFTIDANDARYALPLPAATVKKYGL